MTGLQLYIAELRERFAKDGQPTVSKEAVLVNDHDFRFDALGLAVPYGVHDTLANRGTLYGGTSHDSPEFVVDNLVRWWCEEGEARYPEATDLLVLTVCHYPTDASKWNPTDHRLFSEITMNGQAVLSTASRPSSPTRQPLGPKRASR